MDSNLKIKETALRVLIIIATIVIAAAMMLSLGSCSAQWHIKRAIAKDPSALSQNQTVKIDTLMVTEPKYLNDTVVLKDIDSVTITQDRVVTKLWRVNDTIRVNTICPSDTVRITVEKDCPPTVMYSPRKWWEKQWINALLFIALVCSIAYIVVKKITW